MITPLPIDSLLEEIVQHLEGASHQGRLVLEAPPGAGKTTRVPWALTQAGFCRGRVLVTEPRRIAAKLSATRVAEERGLRLGEEVGYQVRFEERAKSTTRLVYMTEGMLLRQLAQKRDFSEVSAVVFDEVHEQSADLEIALGLLTRMQASYPELRLVAMSATLDAERISQFWGGARRLSSEGRSFPVQIEYDPKPDERPLEIRVRSAVRRTLEQPGDTLVFLPGAREIQQCEEALRVLPDLEVVPLHGDLPIEAQTKVVRGSSAKQRVVLSTNIAESSLTIPGITKVIDSGLARLARHDPWSGIQRLELEEISRSRAIQRAGRAGRTAPGLALRLYTEHNFDKRPFQETAELERIHLSAVLLLLRSIPVSETELSLLTTLPEKSWEQAREELIALGALDARGLTKQGRRLLDFPLPPRLARILLEAEELHVGDDGALAVSLLAERDILKATRGFESNAARIESSDSDLEDRMDRFRQAQEDRFHPATLRRLELDPMTTKRVEQAYGQLRRLLRAPSSPASSVDLTRALFTGFWDRVSERKGAGRELLLMNGSTARLAETSGVTRAPFLLALSADAPRGKQGTNVVRLASRIDAEQLFELGAARIETREEYLWSGERERVEQISALTYGKVTLDASTSTATPGAEAGKVLYKIAKAKGAVSFDPEARLESLHTRLNLLLSRAPELLEALDETTKQELEGWVNSPQALTEYALAAACEECVRLDELQLIELSERLLYKLPRAIQSALLEWTPLSLTLPQGRRLDIHYESGKSPWIESRLQDFFGMTRTPSIIDARLPLQIHFLAPNKRAVQVTTDLEGFWERHYPTLRKELMRRYPKHAWPEDGRNAQPPQPGKLR